MTERRRTKIGSYSMTRQFSLSLQGAYGMHKIHSVNSSKLAMMLPIVLAACGCADDVAFAQTRPFATTVIADFDEPWAMAFLPDGRLLISEKRGALKLHTVDGETLD